jgi:hypothetical protein
MIGSYIHLVLLRRLGPVAFKRWGVVCPGATTFGVQDARRRAA